jgi:hypothetical protein
MTVVGHDLKAATMSCGSVKNVMPQTAQNIWIHLVREGKIIKKTVNKSQML